MDHAIGPGGEFACAMYSASQHYAICDVTLPIAVHTPVENSGNSAIILPMEWAPASNMQLARSIGLWRTATPRGNLLLEFLTATFMMVPSPSAPLVSWSWLMALLHHLPHARDSKKRANCSLLAICLTSQRGAAWSSTSYPTTNGSDRCS